jgi:hypothetical protein
VISVSNYRDDITSLNIANLALRVSLTATRAQIVRSDAVIKDIISNLSIIYNSKL